MLSSEWAGETISKYLVYHYLRFKRKAYSTYSQANYLFQMYKVSFWSQKYILLKVVGLKDLTYYVIDCIDYDIYIITLVSNC